MGDLTLIQLQIVTGRRHQIRFHAAEIGHVLVGDSKYDDSKEGICQMDRNWCPRVFLHSYCSKFREPFTERWFEATSPLPQDLGEVLEKNTELASVGKWEEERKILTRRHLPLYQEFMKQY